MFKEASNLASIHYRSYQVLQEFFEPQTMSTPTTARERAANIKKQQENALAKLSTNALFIVLWIRSDPPRQNDFHWGYYFHASPQGGSKYHMKNIGGGWIPDHGPTGGVFKSNFLCVLIQVAMVPESARNTLDQPITCRVGAQTKQFLED